MIPKTIAIVLLALALVPVNATIPDLVTHEMKEVECLARNIYFEARGESRAGMIAVGHVTMNRSADRDQSVCATVRERTKSTCQFSWVCMKKLPVLRREVYQRVRTLAARIYRGEVKDNTRGATHFHSVVVRPAWSYRKRVTARIGRHIFYKA